MSSHKQNDVVFPEVPTLKTTDLRDPDAKKLLEAHFPTVYGQYHTYLKSWQSYLRAQRAYLRGFNSAIWDVPANSAQNVNGFKNGGGAVFFDTIWGELPHGRIPKRHKEFC